MRHKITARRFAATAAAAGVVATSLACGTAEADADAEADESNPSGPALVETDLGPVQGSADDGVASWLGLPYAAPPVDDLRWASPEPAEPWDDVRAADEFGPACAQGIADMPAVPSEEEDCLYLNVYAPEGESDDLPVMVWFHGGGNTYGAGSQYDPSRLVADGEAVVITVNYRQGLFGSMAHPSLDEGGQTTSGNYGLEDQQAALEWTRANAEAFGGDDGNVTIFGESGGGYDVCAHLTSPSSKDLFDKAIAQSSPCAGEWAPSREEGRDRDTAVAESLGCQDEACLRDLEPAEIIEATGEVYEAQPVVGGPVMPVPTGEAIEAGQVADVPVLSGINRDEEQLMTAGQEILTGEPMSEDDYLAALEEAFGPDAATVAEQYPAADYEAPAKALGAVMTDSSWAADAAATTRALGEHTDVYAYEMAAEDTPWFVDFDRPEWSVDSYHMLDVAFLFDTELFEPLDGAHEPLADAMVEHWSTFAHTGDPDADGPWSPTDDGASARRLSPEGASDVDFAADHRLSFWESLGA